MGKIYIRARWCSLDGSLFYARLSFLLQFALASEYNHTEEGEKDGGHSPLGEHADDNETATEISARRAHSGSVDRLRSQSG